MPDVYAAGAEQNCYDIVPSSGKRKEPHSQFADPARQPLLPRDYISQYALRVKDGDHQSNLTPNSTSMFKKFSVSEMTVVV